MQQLEIKFFFPLTEQIPLDLDFSPCYEYEANKRAEIISRSTLSVNGGGIVNTMAFTDLHQSFSINIDQTPLTVVSKNKPNIFRRYLYKILGVTWKVK
jgi:hypothetical protein